jgi:hypothetical protein
MPFFFLKTFDDWHLGYVPEFIRSYFLIRTRICRIKRILTPAGRQGWGRGGGVGGDDVGAGGVVEEALEADGSGGEFVVVVEVDKVGGKVMVGDVGEAFDGAVFSSEGWKIVSGLSGVGG